MSNNDILEFQIYDQREAHVFPHGNSSDSDSDNTKLPNYIIHVFGKTLEGKSVYCKVTGFTPYFFLKLPEDWNKKKAKKAVEKMKNWLKSDLNRKVWPKKYKDGLLSIDIISKKDPNGFTNDKEFLFALLIFSNDISRKKFANLFDPPVYQDKNKPQKIVPKKPKIYIPGVAHKGIIYPVYEANCPPFLRCFHIQNIKGCSWIQVDKKDCELPDNCEEFTDSESIDEDDKLSLCDFEFTINWKKLKPIERDYNAPLIIASFDIECDSIDGQFPQARRSGDKIIQIGTTYTRLGESVPFRQHIVCLNKTANIEGAIVESYKNEKKLVNGWLEEIRRSDCDIITGYNIFYFDEKYIFDRCEEILDFDEIHYLSKLKNLNCNFKQMELSSSAMGQNLLRFWETPGRVHIDLMKDVQKTFNLSSYKLDSVAAHFIRGEIESIEKKKGNKYILKCKSVNDIFDDDFIHIEILKSFVSDYVGKKYNVLKVDQKKKTILIKTDFDILKEREILGEGKLFWSQAKDDVGPKDIFRLQKGSPQDRAIVAKYCVKDCRLVNLLMNKLEVVNKNIQMANVCYVPLYYLFTRGQGIKLFSLCLKFYRDAGYVFPVKRKPLESLGSYEGAIVFDPIPSTLYEALCVKDYASLYPSSILHKNMSHETKIIDEKYDNLPGVTYYNAQFRDNNGVIQYRRFAKLGDNYGVVPNILDTLLKERKKVKKLMKVEKDPFKKSMLNNKQLALKVTANSLYGQLGAATSPVRDRDIAACTTSTGREMLIFAKKYDEEILPWIMNGLKYAKLKNDDDTYQFILKQEMKDFNNEKLKKTIENYLESMDGITSQPVIKYGDTDSIFSCYRYRRGTEEYPKEHQVSIWKRIIEFSRELVRPFIPDEYKDLWDEYHYKYYPLNKIKKLEIPQKYKVKPKPDHWKTILSVEDRMLQFLKEYMEESYLPWLWTLQDLFLKEYNDLSYLKKKVYDDVLNVRIFLKGEFLIEQMRLCPVMLPDNEKTILIEKIKFFVNEVLKDVWIQPYWKLKKNKVEKKIKLYHKGEKIIEKDTLSLSIKLGIISGELVKSRLPPPHDLEYEKTFWPYIILTKKRYVGNKYEFDENKFYMDYMGIVLKRRDNSPIVKEVCDGIITRLLNDRNPKLAKKFVKKCLKDMFKGKYDIKYFLTSKTLKMKESYKDWTRIAHVVLADRIAKRDPGNKPQSGDRIEYAAVEIENETKDTLQGDRIETPKFIKEKGLNIDYLFYMKNQIMKPSLQFLELVIKNPQDIFDKFKFKEENKRKGQVDILKFVKTSKKDSDEELSDTKDKLVDMFLKRSKKNKYADLDI